MRNSKKQKKQPTGTQWGWMDNPDEDGTLSTGARPAAIRKAQERKRKKQLEKEAKRKRIRKEMEYEKF